MMNGPRPTTTTGPAKRSLFNTIGAVLALLTCHYLVLHFLFFDTTGNEGRLLRVLGADEQALPGRWEGARPMVGSDDRSSNKQIPDIIEDSAMVTGHNITYKLPAKRIYDISSNDNGVVVGVLSARQHRQQRDSIRATWAYNRKNVFFILAGSWDEVKEEFLDYRDILWLSKREGYYKLTWKTQAFVVAMEKHIKNFRHILKTDDDTYVRLGALEQASTSDFADEDYIGYCMEGMKSAGGFLEPEYPPYASGAGYLMSKSFAQCYSNVIEHWSSSVHEDANTGQIARHCKVDCSMDERIVPWRWKRGGGFDGSQEYLMQHYVTTPVEMYHLHSKSCQREDADPISCTPEMAEESYEEELPVWCGRYSASSCNMCTTNATVARPRCAGDCKWCRPLFRANQKIGRGQCVPRKEECVAHLPRGGDNGAVGGGGGDGNNQGKKTRHIETPAAEKV